MRIGVEIVVLCVAVGAFGYQLATGVAIGAKEAVRRDVYPDIFWFTMFVEGLVIVSAALLVLCQILGIL